VRADVGWVTGHTYIVYGAAQRTARRRSCTKASRHPDGAASGRVVDKHKSNHLQAPTAIRALMRERRRPVEEDVALELRLLGTSASRSIRGVGVVYHRVSATAAARSSTRGGRPETGGILITPLPGATKLKPGSATLPFFGVKPQIGRSKRQDPRRARARGNLVLLDSWPVRCAPSTAITSASSTRISSNSRACTSRATARARDEDGYYWITGRVDDVINVSGHRLGTAESRARSSATRRSRRPPSSASRTT
jgi:acetyl-CoA synthetase